MTDEQTPPDWLLLEAARRCGWSHDPSDLTWLRKVYVDTNKYTGGPAFCALCDALIAEPMKPPVDRKLLCAREAIREYWTGDGSGSDMENLSVRAIELWERGYGA